MAALRAMPILSSYVISIGSYLTPYSICNGTCLNFSAYSAAARSLLICSAIYLFFLPTLLEDLLI
jgi:hypothetical protein